MQNHRRTPSIRRLRTSICLALLALGSVAAARPQSATPTAPSAPEIAQLGAGVNGLADVVGANYHRSNARQSYEHWVDYQPLVAEEEVAFLRAHGFNALRTFLSFDAYEQDSVGFLQNLFHYARTLATNRIIFLPVLFDSFGEEPTGDPLVDVESAAWLKSPATATLSDADFVVRAQQYIADVVVTVNQAIQAVGDPRVWWLADLWNEPSLKKVGHPLLATLLQSLASRPLAPPTTVGFAYFADNEPLLQELTNHEDLCVLSGHPYGMFEEVIQAQVAQAVEIGNAYGGKPVFVSEVGLPGLFQYYGSVLCWLDNAGVGFTLWEAFIGANQFRHLTGIFYPQPVTGGYSSVRSTTAANALWSLVKKRTPNFVPPSVARTRHFDEDGYIALGPAAFEANTRDYQEFLTDHATLYGTRLFPFLDVARPSSIVFYERLITWTYLGLTRFFTFDTLVAESLLNDLVDMQSSFELGDIASAEESLFRLVGAAGTAVAESGAKEPDNYPPEFLDVTFDARPRPNGTFSARIEAIAFDIDREELEVRLFAYDADAGFLYEFPIQRLPNTTAYVYEVTGVPQTGGARFVLAIEATDPHGASVRETVATMLP